MTPTRNQSVPLRHFAWIHLAIVVALCAALPTHCVAQNSKLAPEKRTQIDAAISKFMASTHVPGLSVAVVENGEYEWAQGFGFADLENNAPASEHTLFRLGSISKPLTATAALQLWERGKLDLDAPVQKYCPAFPQKPWPISTRQVLGHLGGIRHYNREKTRRISKAETRNTLTIPLLPD